MLLFTLQNRAAIAGVIDLGTVETFPVFEAALRGLVDQETGRVLLETQLVLGGLVRPDSSELYSLDRGLTLCLIDTHTRQSLAELERAVELFRESADDQRLLPVVVAMESGLIREEVGLRVLELQMNSGGLRDSCGGTMSLEQAEDMRLLSPRILYKLHSRLQHKELIDPNTAEKVSLEELKLRCIPDNDSGLLLLPVKQQPGGTVCLRSGRRVGIFRAVQEGLIDRAVTVRLLEAQLFAGGISDPRSGHRLTVAEAVRHGLMDQDLACAMLARQLQNGGVIDPINGERLDLEESIRRDLLSPRLALLVLESLWSFTGLLWPESGELMPVAEALQQGVISGDLARNILRQRHAIGGLYSPETLQVLPLNKVAKEGLEPDVIRCLRDIHIPDVLYGMNQSGTPSLNHLSWESSSSPPPLSCPTAAVWEVSPTDEDQANHKLLFHLMTHSYVDAHSGKRLVLLDLDLSLMVKAAGLAAGESSEEKEESLESKMFSAKRHKEEVITSRGKVVDETKPRHQEVKHAIAKTSSESEEDIISETMPGVKENYDLSLTEPEEFQETKVSPTDLARMQQSECETEGDFQRSEDVKPLMVEPQEDVELERLVLQLKQGGLITEEGEKLLPDEAVAQGVLPGHTAVKLMAEAGLFGGFLDATSGESLSLDEVMQEGLLDEDLMWSVLKSDKTLAGVVNAEKSQICGVREAAQAGLIDPNTAARLLEAQVAYGGIVDLRRDKKVSVTLAANMGLIDEGQREELLALEKAFRGKNIDSTTSLIKARLQLQMEGVVDPETKSVVPLEQAVKRGLIKSDEVYQVLARQVAEGGIIHHASGLRLSVSEAVDRGLVDRSIAQGLEELEWIYRGKVSASSNPEAVALQATTGAILDPDTGAKLTLTEAVSKGLLDEDIASEVMASPAVTQGTVDPKTVRIVPYSELVSQGKIDIRTGKRFLEVKTFQGVQDEQTSEILTLPEAVALKRVDPVPALRLLQSQAETGGIIDISTGERLTLPEAAARGLVGDDMVREFAINQFVEGGLVDPATGRRVPDLSDAISLRLVTRDLALEIQEALKENFKVDRSGSSSDIGTPSSEIGLDATQEYDETFRTRRLEEPEPEQSMDLLAKFASNVEKRIQQAIQEIMPQEDTSDRMENEGNLTGVPVEKSAQTLIDPDEESQKEDVKEPEKGQDTGLGPVDEGTVGGTEELKPSEVKATFDVTSSLSKDSDNKSKKKRKSKKKIKGKEAETETYLSEIKQESQPDQTGPEITDIPQDSSLDTIVIPFDESVQESESKLPSAADHSTLTVKLKTEEVSGEEQKEEVVAPQLSSLMEKKDATAMILAGKKGDLKMGKEEDEESMKKTLTAEETVEAEIKNPSEMPQVALSEESMKRTDEKVETEEVLGQSEEKEDVSPPPSSQMEMEKVASEMMLAGKKGDVKMGVDEDWGLKKTLKEEQADKTEMNHQSLKYRKPPGPSGENMGIFEGKVETEEVLGEPEQEEFFSLQLSSRMESTDMISANKKGFVKKGEEEDVESIKTISMAEEIDEAEIKRPSLKEGKPPEMPEKKEVVPQPSSQMEKDSTAMLLAGKKGDAKILMGLDGESMKTTLKAEQIDKAELKRPSEMPKVAPSGESMGKTEGKVKTEKVLGEPEKEEVVSPQPSCQMEKNLTEMLAEKMEVVEREEEEDVESMKTLMAKPIEETEIKEQTVDDLCKDDLQKYDSKGVPAAAEPHSGESMGSTEGRVKTEDILVEQEEVVSPQPNSLMLNDVADTNELFERVEEEDVQSAKKVSIAKRSEPEMTILSQTAQIGAETLKMPPVALDLPSAAAPHSGESMGRNEGEVETETVSVELKLEEDSARTISDWTLQEVDVKEKESRRISAGKKTKKTEKEILEIPQLEENKFDGRIETEKVFVEGEQKDISLELSNEVKEDAEKTASVKTRNGVSEQEELKRKSVEEDLLAKLPEEPESSQKVQKSKEAELLKKTTLKEEEKAALVLKAKESILKKVFEKGVSETQASRELDTLRQKEARKKQRRATTAAGEGESLLKDRKDQVPVQKDPAEPEGTPEDMPAVQENLEGKPADTSSGERQKIWAEQKDAEAPPSVSRGKRSKRSKKLKSLKPAGDQPEMEKAPTDLKDPKYATKSAAETESWGTALAGDGKVGDDDTKSLKSTECRVTSEEKMHSGPKETDISSKSGAKQQLASGLFSEDLKVGVDPGDQSFLDAARTSDVCKANQEDPQRAKNLQNLNEQPAEGSQSKLSSSADLSQEVSNKQDGKPSAQPAAPEKRSGKHKRKKSLQPPEAGSDDLPEPSTNLQQHLDSPEVTDLCKDASVESESTKVTKEARSLEREGKVQESVLKEEEAISAGSKVCRACFIFTYGYKYLWM